MKRILALALAALLLALPTLSLAEITFDGTVVAGQSVSVTAPFGGTVSAMALKEGTAIAVGDPIATIATTRVYAPEDGTVTGVFGVPGDAVENVISRYGAVMYIMPVGRYQISATIDKAYNSSETKYVTIGETVYISCTADGSHTAVGTIIGVEGTGYTVVTSSGELLMEETVYLYRSPEYTSTSRIGRGTVSRVAELNVSGNGSILFMHVKDGDTVKKGDLLFETVADTFDGLYATSNEIVSDAAGIVASISAQVGGTVNKGDTLLTIYPREDMQVEISVDEYDLPELHEGDTVSLTFSYNEDSPTLLTGTVTHISQLSTASSSGEASYNAYIDFTPTDDIRLGMSVVVNAGT